MAFVHTQFTKQVLANVKVLFEYRDTDDNGKTNNVS